jgi:hypothetical protein
MQALNVGWQVQAPPPQPSFPAEAEEQVYHQYTEETVSHFTPQEVDKLHETEEKMQRGKQVAPKDADDAETLRAFFSSRPQLDKKGPDGVTQLYSSGAILTNDVLVGYWSEELDGQGEQKDVLNFFLLWSDGQGANRGWTMPGMRDRAYERQHPTISIQDANAQLIEKECGLRRADIAHQAILSSFDDRLREDRFIPYSIVSFVLLNKKPPIEPGRSIGLPFNVLEGLVKRERKLPHAPNDPESAYMARNHDSILRKVFTTAKFFHTMEKVRIAQANFKERLRADPNAERPAMPTVEPNQECTVCMNLLVGARIICSNGHSVCQVCLPLLRNCPECRAPTLERPINNIQLDALIQSLQPVEYQRRYQEINAGQVPQSWRNQPAFHGQLLTYRVQGGL